MLAYPHTNDARAKNAQSRCRRKAALDGTNMPAAGATAMSEGTGVYRCLSLNA